MFPHRIALAAAVALTITAAADVRAQAPAAPATPPAPAPAADLAQFAGAWKVAAAELGGTPAAELVGAKFSFTSDTATFMQVGPDGTPDTDDHPFRIDAKTRRLLIYQQAGSNEGLQKGIYMFGKNGNLFLCLTAPDAAEFPTEFTSKPEFLLLKLERPTP